jgi:thiamine biosynthesis lipoprotein
MSNVGLGKILVTDSLIRKVNRGITLDLTDFGQAQALDELSSFMDNKGVENYFLQIGRHALAKGLNEKKELWKIKTAYPLDSTGIKNEGLIALENKAISTSGDFSSFYKQDSLKKPFQVDPRSGYPVNHGLLGVRVLAKNSKIAAIASQTLLVQGLKEGLRLDSARSDLEMILIFNEKVSGIQIYASPELRSYLSFPIK